MVGYLLHNAKEFSMFARSMLNEERKGGERQNKPIISERVIDGIAKNLREKCSLKPCLLRCLLCFWNKIQLSTENDGRKTITSLLFSCRNLSTSFIKS